MASLEMIAELQKRRKELLQELQAIDVLLGANAAKAAPQTSKATSEKARSFGFKSTRDEHIEMLGQKTDAISWKEYTYKALTILGPTPVSEVSELVIDTNDHKIPDQRIKDAIKTAMRTLEKEKRVGVKDQGNDRVFFSL